MRRRKTTSQSSGVEGHFLVEFLQRESHDYEKQVRAHAAQLYQYVGFGIASMGAAAAILWEYKQYAVLLAIPPVAVIIWLMGLRVLTELYALAAHRYWMEEKISEILEQDHTALGGRFVPWESAGGKVVTRSIANVAVFVVFGIVALGLCVGSFVGAFENIRHARALIVTDSVATSLIAIVVAFASTRILDVYPATLELLRSESGRIP